MDDLLDSELGKNDYDWLLTPPETPIYPPSGSTAGQFSSTAQGGRSSVRSVSNARASKLSASQSENNNLTRPVRSSSVTRPSISSSYSTSYSNNNRTSVLNTSSASITSRPSTPGNRSTTQPSSRSSLSSRPVQSRPSTPVKTRPSAKPSAEKPLTSHNSRPSTPTSRPHIPTSSTRPSLNSSTTRSTSRPSTPTRRPTTPASGPSIASSPSVVRVPISNGRASAPSSRPSSPSPRARAPVRPIDLPDFPHEVPPNLRTKLPESRPASAGRSRPGAALTVRANSNSEAATPANSNRRHSLPVVNRGRFPENTPKARVSSNGHDAALPEMKKSMLPDVGARRPAKPAATATESTGFGRNISKKSLDMALRHMDIYQGMGGIRAASLFPQSIRSAAALKGRPARMSDPVVPVKAGEVMPENGSCNGTMPPDCNGAATDYANSAAAAQSPSGESPAAAARERERESELDPYGSYRYDAMLLKEDSKNMNWLHSAEDKSDQGPVFDHRFEPLLPEPFGLL